MVYNWHSIVNYTVLNCIYKNCLQYCHLERERVLLPAKESFNSKKMLHYDNLIDKEYFTVSPIRASRFHSRHGWFSRTSQQIVKEVPGLINTDLK